MVHLMVIGHGAMGGAIASIATKGGNTVDQVGRSGGQVTGDIVVLAVPHPELAGIVAERGPHLAGKVVVDITNPLNFETFDSLTVPPDSSAAAELADALPDS